MASLSSTRLPNVAGCLVAENLAFVASLRFSGASSSLFSASTVASPSTQSLLCISAAAETPLRAPEKPPLSKARQAFIPLLIRDKDGQLTLRTPNGDILSPSDIQKLKGSSSSQSQTPTLASPRKKSVQQKLDAPSPPSRTLTTAAPPKPPVRDKKAATGPPKYSKAARRYYNQHFREPQRLNKVLAAAGVASRRTSEEFIFEGRVTVNGDVCKVPQTLVDPLKDMIYVDGHSLPKKAAPKLYFVLNKPKGYICSSGENESKSVLSFFNDYMKIWTQRNPGVPKPRLFTVGRLDVATSGLLFVTNDGDFTFHVSHPSSNLSKEYIATVGDKVTKRQLQAIADGTIVQGVRCVPDSVELIDGEKDDIKKRLRIVVSEGRNHEVRNLVENAGLEVHALKRVRIGGYRLPRTLGLGKHLLLSESDLKKAQLIDPEKNV